MTEIRGIEKVTFDDNGSMRDASFNSGKIKVDEMSFENVANTLIDTINRTSATVSTGALSLVEGLGELTEAIGDAQIISKTAIESIGYGLYDGGQALFYTGKGTINAIKSHEDVGKSIKNEFNNYESITKKAWEDTKAFVSKQHVKTAFDKMYDNTRYGNFLKDNSYGFQTVRNVGSGVGYVGGIVAISVATFGVGGAAVGGTSGLSATMAAIGGTAGFGKGSEEAWNDGASVGKGLAYGAASGAFEGAQFYAGGQINGLSIGKNALINSSARVGLDGLTGAAEGLARPAIQGLYKDESYKELFKSAGGWKNVGMQAGMAAGMSAMAEGSGLAKTLRENKVSGMSSDESIPMDLQFFAKENMNSKYINEKGLLDSKLLPLSSDQEVRTIQQKLLDNKPLSLSDKLKLRDNAKTTIDGIDLKSDHMYRATDYEALHDYLDKGIISNNGKGKGYNDVNWYLGGTSTRYGKVIIETPADMKKFSLTDDFGGFMSGNPHVRQAHSTNTNPVSFDAISKIYLLDESGEKVLKIIDPKTSKNIIDDIKLGQALYEQNHLTNMKKGLGNNISKENQVKLDNSSKFIDNINGSNSTKNLEFYNQFPDGRIGANQGIVSAVMNQGSLERQQLLINTAKKYFPETSDDEIRKMLIYMDKENGGICDYATVVNSLVTTYKDNPRGFEEAFGYSLTRVNDSGFNMLNDDLLLTDMYCYFNKDKIKVINGESKFVPSYKYSIDYNASNDKFTALVDVENYLASKGINKNVDLEPIYNNYDIMPYQYNIDIKGDKLVNHISKEVDNAFQSGGSVSMLINPGVTKKELKLTNLSTGEVTKYNGNGHVISVIGKLDNNNLIVGSWGNKYSIAIADLEDINTAIYKVNISDKKLLDKSKLSKDLEEINIDKLIASTTDENKLKAYNYYKVSEELLSDVAKQEDLSLKEFGEQGKITANHYTGEIHDSIKDNSSKIIKKAKKFEPIITKDMHELETNDMFLYGENHKFKSEGRIEEKIISKANISATERDEFININDVNKAADEVGDSLRYTLITDESSYRKNIAITLNELEQKGYKVVNPKNTWKDGSRYKGVNVNLEKELNGEVMKFELQFHTPESYQIKGHMTHDVYEIMTNNNIDSMYTKLASKMQEVLSETITRPKNIENYNYLEHK